ncbi:hypothetical protein V8C37DRAFT_416350 [Trichoderma ceciliae]
MTNISSSSVSEDDTTQLSNIMINISLDAETEASSADASFSTDNDDITLVGSPFSTPSQHHAPQLRDESTRRSLNNWESITLPLESENVKDILSTSQSLEMPDHGIAVILPSGFVKPGLVLSPFRPVGKGRAASISLVGYGPAKGVNPVLLCDTAFLVEVKDEERLQRSIDARGFGTLERLLEDIYEQLYGSL